MIVTRYVHVLRTYSTVDITFDILTIHQTRYRDPMVAICADVYRANSRGCEPWSNTDHDNTTTKHRLQYRRIIARTCTCVLVRARAQMRRNRIKEGAAHPCLLFGGKNEEESSGKMESSLGE